MKNRFKSMLKVDFRRMFTMPLIWIFAGACLVMPILILVMTTMFGETPDPVTGEVPASMFTNAWQIIGTAGSAASIDMSAMMNSADAGAATGMDMTSMCNINLLYFGAAVFICLFVTEDFKSGYSKNLFTVRAKRSEYVFSKTLAGTTAGAFFILAFFVGTMLGGAISGLSFDLGEATAANVVMCLLSKIFLIGIFAAICVLASVVAKQKTWLAMIISLGIGMLLFMMIPMITPLDAGIMNVILCLMGSAIFGFGLGTVSSVILKKTNLV